MSQVSSPEVPSGSGLSVRQAINGVLSALMSSNSGPAEPSNPVAGMTWFDTTVGDLKVRNAANTGWLLLSDMIGAVEYDRAMSLTTAQKAQARTNIAAALKLPSPGEVESLVWAQHQDSNVTYGGTYPGSKLRPTGGASSIYVISTNFTSAASQGAALTGTWICLGAGVRNSTTAGVASVDFAYLFQRIS